MDTVAKKEVEDWSEESIRRRVISTCAIVGTPLFMYFTILEMTLQHMGNTVLMFVVVILCLTNLVYARLIGFNLMLVRSSIAYVVFCSLYYMLSDFYASSPMFILILPFITSFILGHKEAIFWNMALAGIGGALILYAGPLGLVTLLHLDSADYFACQLLALVLAYAYEQMRSSAQQTVASKNYALVLEIEERTVIEEKNQQLVDELKLALGEVEELSGLLPMCSSCKMVRIDEGFWEQVESYLHKRTKLIFTHSLCPTCTEIAQSELDSYEDTLLLR